MKGYCLSATLMCLLLMGCVKKYKFTSNVCNGKLYAENFNVNPAGVDAVYLTDSLNFRLYVGKFDNEHENFHFICKEDSVVIEKIASIDTTSIMRVIETRVYNLVDLKKKGKFE